MNHPQENSLIWVLAAIQLTHIMDFMIMMPLGPELMLVFDINALQFGALVSTYTAAAALASLISAFVLDRYDRRSALLSSYALFAVATLACALAEGYWQLMAARFFAGFFGGMIGVLSQTIVADVVPFERRGAAMGKLMAAFSVATVAGVPLALLAANASGWHAPFFILAFGSCLVWLAAFKWVPSLTMHREGEHESMLRAFINVLCTARYWMAYGFTLALVFTGFIVIPFVTLHLQNNVGMLPEQIPLIYFVGGFATLITAPLIGKLSDVFGKRQLFIGLALTAMVPLYLVTHLEPTSLIWILATTTLFFVLISGRMIPSMAVISEVPIRRQRGAFMSLNMAFQSAGMAAAAYVGGWLATGQSGQLDFFAKNGFVGISASLLSICLFLLLLRTMKTQPPRL